MKFKKHFEDPVIFPVKLDLCGNICQTGSQQTTDDTSGEGMDSGDEHWNN